MGRLAFFTVLVVLMNQTVFAQNQQVVPMSHLVQDENDATNFATAKTAISINYTPNSEYLSIEVLGSDALTTFHFLSASGKEMYRGSGRGFQLIDVSTWPNGSYYLISNGKSEQIYISK